MKIFIFFGDLSDELDISTQFHDEIWFLLIEGYCVGDGDKYRRNCGLAEDAAEQL